MTRFLVALSLVFFSATSLLAAPPINLDKPSFFGGKYSYALDGYDPVSYFSETGPAKGSKNHTAEHQGVTWLFKTEENKQAFLADPEAYKPQYGAYCAWAASQGYLAAGNPKVWRIVEGKLYLNYDKSVARDWIKDIPGFIELADKNFPTLIAEE